MQRCLAAGITPGEFWNLTLEESFILMQAYYDRVNVQWAQTRLIVYTIACTVTKEEDRGEIYDLFWLPGDPSPEERAAQVKADHEAMIEEHHRLTQLVREGKL